MYAVGVVLPLEIKIPSLHVALQDYIIDEVAHQIRLDQLLLLDERRIHELEHIQTYHNHIDKAFNKQAKIYEFDIWDLVLK